MTLEQVQRRLAKIQKREGIPSWYFNPELEQAQIRFELSITLDEWDAMSDDAKGDLIATKRAQDTMDAWRAWVTRPKPRRAVRGPKGSR